MKRLSEVLVRCRVNDEDCEIWTHPMRRLLDVIREDLRLTGTKEGCGEGECGACSVMVDGALVNSCLVPVLQVDGSEVRTIEGVPQPNAVQQAFIKAGAAQCGICTPGMVMATLELLKRHPEPTEEQIRHGLAGNICRCTGYMRIFASIGAAIGEAIRE